MEDELKAKGWHLTAEGIEYCVENGNRNIENVIQNAKDIDLKEIGKQWLPEELSRGKCEYIQGPGVVQIQKIRNTSAPKENEESQVAPRLLKLTFTDGKLNCNAIEMEKLDKISLETPPGTKIFLKGTIGVEHGFLLLRNKNTVFLGGRVEKMAENWELKKLLSKQSRGNVGREGGPPPFVPFGQRIRENKPQQIHKKDNFKSLETATKKTEDAEFEQQRQATIAEALQAKDDGKSKSFGGQKQVGRDQDIARIVDMGFTAEDASSALRQNNGNVNDAIHSLLGGKAAPQNRQGFQRDRQGPPSRDDRKIPVRDERKDNYKGNRGKKDRDDEFVVEDTKPSAPATLFDFLETKIKPSKEEKDSVRNSDNYSKHVQSKSGHDYSESKSYSHQQSSNQYHDQRNQGQGQRNKTQNIPPRFNKSGREGTSSSNSYSSNKHSDHNRPYSSPASQNGHHTTSDYNDRTSRQNIEGDRNNKTSGNRQQYSSSSQQRSDNYDKRTSRNNKNNYQNRNSYDQEYNQQYRPKSSQNYDRKQNDKVDNYDQRRGRGDNYDQNRDNRNQNRDYQNRNQRYENKENNYDQRGGVGRNLAPPQQQQQQQQFQQPPPPQQQYFQQPQPATYQQYQKPPPTFIQPMTKQWSLGEMCLAKYWEDNKFYPAVVEAVAPELPTCVVTFVDYGNTEEVCLTDLKPHPVQNTFTTQGQYPGNYGNPNLPQQQGNMAATNYAPAYTGNQYQTGNQISSMEFRRRPNDMQRNANRRPTQQYYQPPVQEYQ